MTEEAPRPMNEPLPAPAPDEPPVGGIPLQHARAYGALGSPEGE